jgi:hypothetical protein
VQYDLFVTGISFHSLPITNFVKPPLNPRKGQTMTPDTTPLNAITREDFQALTDQVKHLGDCILTLAAVVNEIDSNTTGDEKIKSGVTRALEVLEGIKDPASLKVPPFAKAKP